MSYFYKQNCVYRKAMEQDLVIPTYQSQASEENYEEKCQILKAKLC
jgi:hypothetical protein